MALSTTARFATLAATISIALAGCGGGGGGSEPRATPTSIVISPSPSASVQSGGTIQFSAQVLDQNGAPMSGQTVTWSSSNTSRATISATGLATASTVGSTTITASLGTLFSNAVALSVTPGAGASLTKVTDVDPNMAAGTSSVLQVRVRDAAGNDVAGASVAFVVSGGGSSLSTAAAVTGTDGVATVTLTVGTTSGQVTTVTATSGSLAPVTFTTTTAAAPPATLSITSPRIVMVDSVGVTTLTVALADAFGNPISTASGVNYTSRNISVATTNGATINGIRRGQSIIVASLASNPAVADSMLLVVAVPNGPVLVSDITRFDLKSDTIFTTVIAMDMRSSGEKLGSTTVQIAWDVSLMTYQSDADGASGVNATVNSSGAVTNGQFRLTVANSSGFTGRVELRRITFRANANIRTGTLALAATELNGISPAFTDLKPKTVGVSYPLRTR